MTAAPGNIFNISSPAKFDLLALEIFRYQTAENPVYAEFLQNMKISPEKLRSVSEIPFLPVSFFKTHKVITGKAEPDTIFISSGTTGNSTSRHYVRDINIYEESYLKCFTHFYGNPQDLCIVALLPSYLEREGSSLIYMANDLIKKSAHPDSGFYLNNYQELIQKLKSLESKKQKTLLIGVTYALLDLFEMEKMKLQHTIIMETGGMKGKRKELIREELHSFLKERSGVSSVHSEYGMTELLSQAYSKGDGKFYCPPWMKVSIRDPNDPLTLFPYHKTGGINIIDLANIYSCSFISTQDLGRTFPDNSFEVLGRFDNSDIRGCNLLVG